MKKIINIVLVLICIVIQVTVALYPTAKKLAKVYVSSLDFDSIINSEPVAEYTVYLGDDEKNELIKMLITSCNNITD